MPTGVQTSMEVEQGEDEMETETTVEISTRTLKESASTARSSTPPTETSIFSAVVSFPKPTPISIYSTVLSTSQVPSVPMPTSSQSRIFLSTFLGKALIHR